MNIAAEKPSKSQIALVGVLVFGVLLVDSMPDVFINTIAGWVRVMGQICPMLFLCN